jgi:hypothetical protein
MASLLLNYNPRVMLGFKRTVYLHVIWNTILAQYEHQPTESTAWISFIDMGPKLIRNQKPPLTPEPH